MIKMAMASRARLATMALFFTTGAISASWAVHIPTIKEKFALSEMLLSLALFMVAAGPISIMTHMGAWITRVGSRIACTAGGLLLCSCLALLLYAPWFGLLLLFLLLFGISFAFMDVAMNAEAVAIETALRKPVMSTLHGLFSIGSAVGAALGGLALAHGMKPHHHLILVSVITAAIVLIARPALLPHTRVHTTAQPCRSWRGLWMLGGIACIAFMTEGAVYDWSMVYMRESVHADYGMASAAYALFSVGMAVGRLCGDSMRARISDEKCVLISGTLACVGMTIALSGRQPGTAQAGFMLMGLGLANIVPVMFAAAARVQGIQAAEGIARVASMGYVGFLLGPVLIGLIAHATTLTISLSLVAICAALIAGLGPRALRSARAL